MSRARLLMSSPIEDRLDALDERAAEHERWGAESTATAIRLCIAEVRDAIEQAAEHGLRTDDAARLTGWSVGTLQKWARAKTQGLSVPHAWRHMDVRIDGRGDYVFTVSTIPVHGGEQAA